MRVVGTQDRSDIEIDPVEAYRRSRLVDEQLKTGAMPRPIGVTRATANARALMDDAHMLQAARRVDPLP